MKQNLDNYNSKFKVGDLLVLKDTLYRPVNMLVVELIKINENNYMVKLPGGTIEHKFPRNSIKKYFIKVDKNWIDVLYDWRI